MTDERQSGLLFESWLKDTDPTPPDASESVAAVMARLPQTRQRGRWWPLPAFERPVSGFPSRQLAPAPIPATNGHAPTRGFTMFSALKFIAASVIVALFSGFLMIGVLTTQQSDEVPPPAVSASPTTEATSAPTDAPADPTPTVAGPGPWLIWERAPDLDESWSEARMSREAAIARLPKAAREGTGIYERDGYVVAVREGRNTHSGPDTPRAYEPLRLWVVGPDGEVDKHVFDRAYRVTGVAIGPAGILVRTGKAIQASFIKKLAIQGRFEKGRSMAGCCELHPDGTVTTDGRGGLPRVIEFGQYRDKLERIGLRRADLGGQRYWLRRDDGSWTEVEPPPETGRLAATDDGYFMLKNRRLYFSADLLGWEVIDEVVGAPGGGGPTFVNVGDRVVFARHDQIAWVGPAGLEPTPFGQAVAEADAISSIAYPRLLPWPGSEKGLVLIHHETNSALFTPDGKRWGLAPLPEPAAEHSLPEFAILDGQLVRYDFIQTGFMEGDEIAHRAIVTAERPA